MSKYTVNDVLAAALVAFEQNGNQLLTRQDIRGNSRMQTNARRVHRILASSNRDRIIEPYREAARELQSTVSGVAMAALSRGELSDFETRIARAAGLESICPGTQKNAIDALVAAPEIQHNQEVNRNWEQIEREHALNLPWETIVGRKRSKGLWGDRYVWDELQYTCPKTREREILSNDSAVHVNARIGLKVRHANRRVLIGAVPDGANWCIKTRAYSGNRDLSGVEVGDQVHLRGWVSSIESSRHNSGVVWVTLESLTKID